jgi:high-affinity nickel permease
VIGLPDLSSLSLFMIGFLLGAKHALDADHVVAILTISAENRRVWRLSLIGLCWGIGHTLILLLVGGAMLLFKLTIPAHWNRGLEAGVGVMLIGLGLSVGLTLWRERFHVHSHTHADGERHHHLHSHREGPEHHHLHRFRLEYKSLAIGMVHGLAGSAAIFLLVLATVPSPGQGLVYILIFGVGSIVGMALLATAMSLPFTLSAGRMARVQQVLRAGAAVVSVGLGITMLGDWLSP